METVDVESSCATVQVKPTTAFGEARAQETIKARDSELSGLRKEAERLRAEVAQARQAAATELVASSVVDWPAGTTWAGSTRAAPVAWRWS